MNYLVKDEIQIPVPGATLFGNLQVPEHATGLVIFSHGSGSSRHSSRNQYVARVLEKGNFATLLFDLLTPAEDADYRNRFAIDILTNRLIFVTQWVQKVTPLQHLPIGYFGASTGAASALGAAARLKETIRAVVSRGGRPDLAINHLPEVTAPTLLLVGSFDHPVIPLNEQAYAALKAPRQFKLVPNASHLFEEPGKLEEVAHLALAWFQKYLR